MKLFITFFITLVFLEVSAQMSVDDASWLSESSEVNLSTIINSPHPEVRPFISPDGNTLFFGRRNTPDNVAGIKDPQDIWYSQREEDGKWGEPKRLESPINDKWANSICSMSDDGKTAYFYNTYKNVNHPIVKSYMTTTGWSILSPVQIEEFYNYSEYADFFIGMKGEVMIMAIEQEKGMGQQDLFVSQIKSDGTYSTPVNLGNVVNTAEPDYAPFLSADGKQLFFVSGGHKGGHGLGDIYVSERLDDSWTSWSKPVNLGSAVNTDLDECYFSITSDYEYIYVDSNTPGSDDRDIKVVPFPDELKPRRFQAYYQQPKSSY